MARLGDALRLPGETTDEEPRPRLVVWLLSLVEESPWSAEEIEALLDGDGS